jgi:hypothetical protein
MRALTTALILSLAACGGGMDADDDGEEEINCAEVTDDDDFVVGLNKIGESNVLQFTIMSGDPAPPIRGDNSWVVEVKAVGGAAIEGASINVTPFMPAHGHGAGKTVEVEAMPAAGQYQLAPVNLWMPGVWETTVDVTSAGGNDQVVFKFCIPS